MILIEYLSIPYIYIYIYIYIYYGRPTTTLPVLLFNEYRNYKAAKKERGWTVKKNSLELLDELRKLAEDRGKWRSLVEDIVQLDSTA